MDFLKVIEDAKELWVALTSLLLVLVMLLFAYVRETVKRWFLGAEWLVKELLMMFSEIASTFSMKRFFTFGGFFMGQYYVYRYWNTHESILSFEQFIAIIGIEFFIGGYVLDKVLKFGGSTTSTDTAQ